MEANAEIVPENQEVDEFEGLTHIGGHNGRTPKPIVPDNDYLMDMVIKVYIREKFIRHGVPEDRHNVEKIIEAELHDNEIDY